MNRNIFLLGSIGLLAALIGVWSASELFSSVSQPVSQPYSVATVMPVPRDLPAISLVDHAAQPFGNQQLEGEWTLLFMGFTNCGHVCPMTMARLRAIKGSLERPVKVLFVSVDPGRDTPAVIDKYVHNFDPEFVGVTGQPQELAVLAAALGAPFYVEQTEDRYTVDHSGAIFIIDPAGKYAGVISPPLEIEAVVADLDRLLGTS
jgi:protein SCO1/2